MTTSDVWGWRPCPGRLTTNVASEAAAAPHCRPQQHGTLALLHNNTDTTQSEPGTIAISIFHAYTKRGSILKSAKLFVFRLELLGYFPTTATIKAQVYAERVTTNKNHELNTI